MKAPPRLCDPESGASGLLRSLVRAGQTDVPEAARMQALSTRLGPLLGGGFAGGVGGTAGVGGSQGGAGSVGAGAGSAGAGAGAGGASGSFAGGSFVGAALKGAGTAAALKVSGAIVLAAALGGGGIFGVSRARTQPVLDPVEGRVAAGRMLGLSEPPAGADSASPNVSTLAASVSETAPPVASAASAPEVARASTATRRAPATGASSNPSAHSAATSINAANQGSDPAVANQTSDPAVANQTSDPLPTGQDPGTAQPSPAGGPLAESEIALLQAAQAELRSSPASALALADRHASRYPTGTLAQEREVIAIQSLLVLDRWDEANQRAARFAHDFPQSAHLPRIEALVRRSNHNP